MFHDDGTVSIQGLPSTTGGGNLPDISGLTYQTIYANGQLDDFYYRQGTAPYTIRRFNKFIYSCVIPVSDGDPPCALPSMFNGNLTEDMQEAHTGGSNNGTIAYWSRRYYTTAHDTQTRNWGLLYEFQPTNATPVQPPDTQASHLDPDSVKDFLSDEVLEMPLSTSAIAAMANAVYNNTEEGIRQMPGQEITADEVARNLENPSSAKWPKVKDLWEWSQLPNSAETGEISFNQPEGNQPVIPPTNPPSEGSGIAIDLGEDPNVTAPALDAPSEVEILQPFKDLITQYSSNAIVIAEGECPIAKFVVFDKEYSIESHCTLIEQQRALIQRLSLFLWSFISFIIVLRA